MKNTLIHGFLEHLVSLARALPPRAARWLGEVVGSAAYHVLAVERKRALSQILDRYEYLRGRESDPPEMRRAWARRICAGVFRNLGRWAGELCSLADRPDMILQRVVIPSRSRRVLQRALQGGRGALFLTGHLGNWEVVAWAVAALGYPATAVGRRSYHDGITDLVHSLRSAAGVQVMYREDPDLARLLLAALRKGRIVGLLVDPSTDLPSRMIPFLGRDAPTLEAPVRLALRHRGAVVFGWCHEGPAGKLVVEIEPVDLSSTRDLDGALRGVTTHVERAVMGRPDHWIWMHRRWDRR